MSKGVGKEILQKITNLKIFRLSHFFKRSKGGFSIIEILLVMAIMVFLASIALPSGVNFYQSHQLNSASDSLVQMLRRAQLYAMAIKDDSSFGVYVGSGWQSKFSLFRGNSYLTKDGEEIIDISGEVLVGGAFNEVTFIKLTGLPNATGNITLTIGQRTKTININSEGRINLQ